MHLTNPSFLKVSPLRGTAKLWGERCFPAPIQRSCQRQPHPFQQPIHHPDPPEPAPQIPKQRRSSRQVSVGAGCRQTEQFTNKQYRRRPPFKPTVKRHQNIAPSELSGYRKSGRISAPPTRHQPGMLTHCDWSFFATPFILIYQYFSGMSCGYSFEALEEFQVASVF